MGGRRGLESRKEVQNEAECVWNMSYNGQSKYAARERGQRERSGVDH